jgi:hypothetical protein
MRSYAVSFIALIAAASAGTLAACSASNDELQGQASAQEGVPDAINNVAHVTVHRAEETVRMTGIVLSPHTILVQRVFTDNETYEVLRNGEFEVAKVHIDTNASRVSDTRPDGGSVADAGSAEAGAKPAADAGAKSSDAGSAKAKKPTLTADFAILELAKAIPISNASGDKKPAIAKASEFESARIEGYATAWGIHEKVEFAPLKVSTKSDDESAYDGSILFGIREDYSTKRAAAERGGAFVAQDGTLLGVQVEAFDCDSSSRFKNVCSDGWQTVFMRLDGAKAWIDKTRGEVDARYATVGDRPSDAGMAADVSARAPEDGGTPLEDDASTAEDGGSSATGEPDSGTSATTPDSGSNTSDSDSGTSDSDGGTSDSDGGDDFDAGDDDFLKPGDDNDQFGSTGSGGSGGRPRSGPNSLGTSTEEDDEDVPGKSFGKPKSGGCSFGPTQGSSGIGNLGVAFGICVAVSTIRRRRSR